MSREVRGSKGNRDCLGVIRKPKEKPTFYFYIGKIKEIYVFLLPNFNNRGGLITGGRGYEGFVLVFYCFFLDFLSDFEGF